MKLKDCFLLILFFLPVSLIAQITISGKVIDENNEPLGGVSINVKGKSIGGTTVDGGNYLISVPDSKSTLQFSFVGYVQQEIKVNGQTIINVQLKKESLALSDVVVVGYGTQRKTDVTGAIATITSEHFNKGTIVSPEQLLQGKLAGVNIGATSGEPGAAMTLTIRGPGSIRGGNSPLFVVDGVPLNNESTSPTAANVGFGSSAASNPLNFLNPGDIKSIDVLKDASATAIYGSRGANGVVIITTKRGSPKESITYSASYGISKVPHKIELLSADKFIDYARKNNLEKNIYDPAISTDWQNEIFRKAFSQNHNLALNGGSDKSNYYASLSFMDQEGLIKNNSLKRYTGRFNINQKMLEGRLKFSINLTASHIDNSGVARTDNAEGNDGNLITNTLIANPTYPARDKDGNIFHFPDGRNPLSVLDAYHDYTKTDRILGNIEGTLEIIKGLEYKLNFGIDHSSGNRDIQLDPSNIQNILYPTGRLVITGTEQSNRIFENYLKYNFTASKNEFTALAGHSYQRFYRRTHGSSINNFSTTQIDAIYNPGIGTDLNISQNLPFGNAGIDELQSFFGRLNYVYDRKYLLTATLRADGSSKFGKNNKYGMFPSFSGAWRISEESWMKDIHAVSNLKIRGGWGQTGNQEIPGKITLPLLSSSVISGQGYPLNQSVISSGYLYTRTYNPDIKWEVASQTNIGLDFGFLEGALTGSVDYFVKKTTDILLNVTVSDPISPVSNSWTNLDMDIINKGLEIAVAYSSRGKKDFNWTIGGNSTFLKNKVENSPFSLISSGSLKGPGLSFVTVNGYMNNQSIGSFYLLEHIGFDANGDNVFRDLNKDGTINADDRIVAGSAVPNLLYNFYGEFSYKNFDLSINFNGVSGNKIYNNTANAYFNRPTLSKGNNVSINVLDNSEENLVNAATQSTRFLENGSFLRLNNASIGYNFQSEKVSWIKNLRIYVTGQNLLVFTKYTGYDPEVNVPLNTDGVLAYGIDFANYPKPRTFIVGLNLSF